jgi:hypothetical protein
MRFADNAIFQLSPSVTRTKVTGPEVLEGFQQLLRLIDNGYKGDVPVATTKKLVADYMPFLKQAAREIQLDADRRGEFFSWDEITDAAKNTRKVRDIQAYFCVNTNVVPHYLIVVRLYYFFCLLRTSEAARCAGAPSSRGNGPRS